MLYAFFISASRRRPISGGDLVEAGDQQIAYTARGDNPNKARQDKAVVNNKLTDARGARAVETDTGQVAGVGRQNEVAIGSREESLTGRS